MITPKQAPLASRVITTEKTETDGWTLLYLLLCSRNPLFGGKGDDVITEISNLCLRNDDDIHKFYERVMVLQEKLEYSTEIISKTKLIEKYLNAMATSSIHHHLLQYYIIDLNLHIAQKGHGQDHPTLTIHSIYQHLLITNAPQNFIVKNNKRYKPNISQLSIAQNGNNITTDHTYEDSPKDNKENISPSNDLSTFMLRDENDEQHYLQ